MLSNFLIFLMILCLLVYYKGIEIDCYYSHLDDVAENYSNHII